MRKATGPRTLRLEATPAPKDEKCEMAKAAYNSARRGKLAYQALVFVLAVVLVVAIIYAVISFDDEEDARGYLALITAAGAFATGGFLGILAKSAAEDEDTMWKRVDASCDGDENG